MILKFQYLCFNRATCQKEINFLSGLLRNILIILISFLSLESSYVYPQSENILFMEIKYPFPAGQNFLSSAYDYGYTGFFKSDMGYERKIGDKLGVGASFSTAYLKMFETNMNLVVLCPTIKGFYYFPVESEQNRVIQIIEVGYSAWNFFTNDLKLSSDTTIVTDQDGRYRDSRNGFTIGSSTKVSYFISERISIYFIFHFSFYRLVAEKAEERVGFNQNVAILSPGIGITCNW